MSDSDQVWMATLSSPAMTLSTGVSVVEVREALRKAGWSADDRVGILGIVGTLVGLSTGLPFGATSMARLSGVRAFGIAGTGGTTVALLSRFPEKRPLIFSKTYLLFERALGV